MNELEATKAKVQRLQHIIDCANTPLMADVLEERDRLRKRLGSLVLLLEEAEVALHDYPGLKACIHAALAPKEET